MRDDLAQEVHEDVLRAVAENMADTPYVLKGGTALLLTRDLPRHSEDLDFDSSKKLNIETRVSEGLMEAGAEIESMKVVKDTDTVQRLKIHYTHPELSDTQFLKIETSFRNEPNEHNIETVDGIKTYKVNEIFNQKLDAMEGRDAARDLYDVSFILSEYGDRLTDAQIERAQNLTKDIDALFHRYSDSYEADELVKVEISLEDCVLSINESLEAQERLRGLDEDLEL